jgi:hypothetical protein
MHRYCSKSLHHVALAFFIPAQITADHGCSATCPSMQTGYHNQLPRKIQKYHGMNITYVGK